ncbi:MAG: monovalent cation/H(+) antiporter subunit G [Alphaproteobacteria bacterium]
MTFELLREWVGGGLALAGGLFMVVGALGLVRLPDVFTRLHAASVIDTAGAGLILTGLILIEGVSLVSVKLLFLILMFGLLGPVAAHAVARAALYAGIKPMVDEVGADAGETGEDTSSKP